MSYKGPGADPRRLHLVGHRLGGGGHSALRIRRDAGDPGTEHEQHPDGLVHPGQRSVRIARRSGRDWRVIGPEPRVFVGELEHPQPLSRRRERERDVPGELGSDVGGNLPLRSLWQDDVPNGHPGDGEAVSVQLEGSPQPERDVLLRVPLLRAAPAAVVESGSDWGGGWPESVSVH